MGYVYRQLHFLAATAKSAKCLNTDAVVPGAHACSLTKEVV